MSEDQALDGQAQDAEPAAAPHPSDNVQGGVTGSSASFKVPNLNGIADKSQTLSLEDVIPGDYKEKPYMQKIKTVDDLFKSFDNAQKLIGQKNSINIPGDDASDEDKAEFRKAMGVPDDFDKYEVKLPEDIKEDMVDAKQMESIKKLAHELGLNNKQLQSLVEFDLARQKESIEYNEKMTAELNEQFDDISKDLFGERHEEVLENAKKLMNKYTPGLLQEHVKNLDNNSLFVMAGVLDNIHRDFIAEDKPVIKGSTAPVDSAESLRQQAWEVMKGADYNNPNTQDPAHQSAVKKVNDLYNRRERLLNIR